MKRRNIVFSLPALGLLSHGAPAWAHHGWSSFDESKPLYLTGKIKAVKWQNPHAEIVMTVDADAALPADLALRKVPAQSNSTVNGTKVLSEAVLPKRRGDWTIELSPMTRIEAWKVPKLKAGDTVSAIAYSFKDEKGEALARVEYLILDDQIFGLRSMPV